ncbi:exported hypothetical protein [Vibrio nigripulchritudo SOn1]|uniref:Uncharacterized protein n=1 Tax=Vibrio nigripulchritudo SOn1 TaxID=1238450 RepID=A0AAV2VTA2_9VIBR|nr:exported hypothetical protein [Vibrio nigripulchritudo SOn1]
MPILVSLSGFFSPPPSQSGAFEANDVELIIAVNKSIEIFLALGFSIFM